MDFCHFNGVQSSKIQEAPYKAVGIQITKNVQGKEALSQLELLPVLNNVIQIPTTMDLNDTLKIPLQLDKKKQMLKIAN